MKKTLIACLIFLTSSLSADAIQSYYKDPTPTHFLEAFTIWLEAINKENNPAKKDHLTHLCNVFMAQVTHLTAGSYAPLIALLQSPEGCTPELADFHWVSFYATGNPLYLEQLLKSTSSGNIVVLWSIESNMEQDETIKSLIETLIAENPELKF